MKKIISLILCLALTVCFAAEAMAEENSNISETLDFLHAIGIMEEYTAETFNAEQKITRAVFAQSVAELINEAEVGSGRVYYHDVSRDYWAFNFIGRLTELGFISGDGKNNFNPEDIISKTEAVKVILSILGYDVYAAANGGYPNGYLKLAGEIKLLSGCSTESDMTLADMAVIFKNALKAETVSVSYTEGELSYSKDEETLLTKCYSMYYDKGTLSGCEGVNLLTGERIKDNKAYIDGFEYETELSNLLGYIGSDVEFIYYSESRDGGERNLLWVSPTGKTDTLTIGIDEDKEFDPEDYVLTYYPEGNSKSKKVRLEKGISVIYNGAFAKDGIDEILSAEKYSVTLLRDGGKYGVAVVEAYENYVVGDIDLNLQVIYDRADSSKKISLDEDDWERVEITRDNATASFSDIKENDVVSIFKAYDGETVKAVILSSFVEGTVENIKDNEEERSIRVDGETYMFYNRETVKNIKVNSNVKLYMDFNGYVAYVSKNLGKEAVAAYILKAYIDENTDSLHLKLLTDDGIKTYACADKIKIDGISTTNSGDSYYPFINDGKTDQQLVIVRFNSNGQVKTVDTTEPNAGSDFRLWIKGASGIYKSNVSKLGAKVLVDDNTRIFSVPSSYSTDESNFSIKHKSALKHDQAYTADVYRCESSEQEFEDILVIKDESWNSPSNTTATILVSSIDKCVNEDDEQVECLNGYQAHTPVSILTNGEYNFSRDKIKPGDMIRVTYNDKGEAKSAYQVFGYKSASRPVSTDLNSAFRIAAVYAHDKIGCALKVGYKSGADFDEVFNIANAKILVYQGSEKNKIRIGTPGDIRTYKTVGEECSTVVTQTTYGEPVVFVVYEE